MKTYTPMEVMPGTVSDAVSGTDWWFVLGGQAVRCLCPYRPSRDVDFGVGEARDMQKLLDLLSDKGKVELLESSGDTVHLLFNGTKISVFFLAEFLPFVEEQRLSVKGLLATKLHAILGRGTRRDFFDLYVLLQKHRLGIGECLSAIREVFRQPVSDALLLRAMTYFDDAQREAPLPGEGKRDWETVKNFFQTRAGSLLIPPGPELEIMKNTVDLKK
jgi:hypothetical protein